MGHLFEAFIRNFLKREWAGVTVARELVGWLEARGAAAALQWLPQMHTDVSVSTPERRTIIEAKFYRTPFARRFDTEKLHAAHIYQLYAYLRNARPKAPGQTIHGILL